MTSFLRRTFRSQLRIHRSDRAKGNGSIGKRIHRSGPKQRGIIRPPGSSSNTQPNSCPLNTIPLLRTPCTCHAEENAKIEKQLRNDLRTGAPKLMRMLAILYFASFANEYPFANKHPFACKPLASESATLVFYFLNILL